LAEVLGHVTISAFDSGNLVPVAQDLHDKCPDKPIIIAGDNDREVEIKQGINPGRVKAEEAAIAVGGKAIFPIFAPGEQDANPAAYSDFNDLATKSLLGKNGIERQVKTEIGRVTIKTDQPLKQKKLRRQQTKREMRRAKTIKVS
jgi:putative DNA primase/helicase